MTKPTVVLDTNVYLSGIIFGGNSRHILDLVVEKKILAAISPAILLEISQKLEKKFKWNKNQILLTIRTIAKSAKLVTPSQKVSVVKEDKSDNKIIEAAIESKANYIISGDRHLLKIKKYQQIKIVSPAEFLNIYCRFA